MGLQSLPVAFGPEVAKWITVGTIDVTQLSVAAYLQFGLHQTLYAAILTGLVLPQVKASCNCLFAHSPEMLSVLKSNAGLSQPHMS